MVGFREVLEKQGTELYPYEKLRRLLGGEDRDIGDSFSYRSSFHGICEELKIWQVLSLEFVRDLGRLLERLSGGTRVLEVMAGSGYLSHHLNQARNGLVHPTDIGGDRMSAFNRMSRVLQSVERGLDWREALEKYRPTVVLASWVPYKENLWDPLMREFDFVEVGVDIGETQGGCTGVSEYKKVTLEVDEDASRHCLAKTDYASGWSHTCVSVVRRTSARRRKHGSPR